MLGSAWLGPVLVVVPILCGSGCELIVDFDRGRIDAGASDSGDAGVDGGQDAQLESDGAANTAEPS